MVVLALQTTPYCDIQGHPRKGTAEARASGNFPSSWHHVDWVDFLLTFQWAQLTKSSGCLRSLLASLSLWKPESSGEEI